MSRWTHLYGTEWRKRRAAFLREHPLCVMHQSMGKIKAATVVDHIKPHRGNLALFWNESGWQPLCSSCHSSAKQSLDRGSRRTGCDEKGYPIGREW